MAIGAHKDELFGQKVIEYDTTQGISYNTAAYRITIGWDDAKGMSWNEKFDKFLQDPNAINVTGFIVGAWQDIHEKSSKFIVDSLIQNASKLPNLQSLFIADVTYEENEISWMIQSDMSALFKAFPNLKSFGARGGNDLRFTGFEHANLERLVIETGGLPKIILDDILSAKLPNLNHLELWLGSEQYGKDFSSAELLQFLTNLNFEKLKYLGLRNTEGADEMAQTVVQSGIISKIQVLDLSLGDLGDEGIDALLTSADITNLKKLDIHHNYATEAGIEKIKTLNIEVDRSDVQEPDEDDRYITVSE